MLIDAPPTSLNTIIHKKHLSHFMAKTMNELAHKSPLIVDMGKTALAEICVDGCDVVSENSGSDVTNWLDLSNR